MIRLLLWLIICAVAADAQFLPADSARGERLFESEHCLECHSVNGKGAHTGPDLGRGTDRDFTPATLVSTMWNHAPIMWSAMRTRNMQAVKVDDQAAADLFAYFYAARFFEKPGDAARGKQLFSEKSCARCHGVDRSIQSAAAPVSRWDSLGDPIALTEAMWNHSSSMGTAELSQGIHLPELSGQNVTDMLVYLRNLSATKATPGSSTQRQARMGKTCSRPKAARSATSPAIPR